jgi:hypothetical protein
MIWIIATCALTTPATAFFVITKTWLSHLNGNDELH